MTKTYAVSLFRRLANPVPNPVNLEWGQLVQLLQEPHQVADKRDRQETHPGWAPALFAPPRRARANVRAVSALVLDLDSTPLDDIDLQSLGQPLAVAHDTMSPGRSRLVIALASSIPPAQFAELRQTVCQTIGLQADPNAADPSRFFWLPCHAAGMPQHRVRTWGGSPLEVGTFLANATFRPQLVTGGSLTDDAPRLFLPQKQFPTQEKNWKNFSFSESVPELVAAIKKSSSKLAPYFLRAVRSEPLADPGGRDDTVFRCAGAAAHLFDSRGKAFAPQVVMEIFAPAIRLMQLRDDDPPGYLESLVRKFQLQYETALMPIVNGDMMLDNLIGHSLKTPQPREEREEPSVYHDGGDDWKGALSRDEKNRIRPVASNVGLILRNDPETRGLCWHVLDKRVLPPAEGSFAKKPLETLHTTLRNWIGPKYGIEVSAEEMRAQMLAFAMERELDPLKDYLEGLKWDGTLRLSEAFLKIFSTVANARYVERVSRSFFISAVARGISSTPSKVDTMLILKGPQGIGKTGFAEMLGGKFFSSSKLTVGEKDSYMMLSKFWVIEMGELSSFKNAGIERLKTFLTTQTDDIRLPYGSTLQSFARRCIFVGTTNEEDFLVDPTGSRRFYVLSVNSVNFDWFRANREQVLAEAVVAYKQGEPWHLDTEFTKMQEVHNMDFQQEMPLLRRIQVWWLSVDTNMREEAFYVDDVYQGLTQDFRPPSAGDRTAIGRALIQMGFERTKHPGPGGGMVTRYRANRNLIQAAPLPKRSKL